MVPSSLSTGMIRAACRCIGSSRPSVVPYGVFGGRILPSPWREQRSLLPVVVRRRYSSDSAPLTSTTTSPESSSSSTPAPAKSSLPHLPVGPPRPSRVQSEPHYQLTFTCVPCETRSTHRVSKQGYHNGSVLITCPKCRNRHVISDHLGIFGDRKITVEDLMRERGRIVRKGTLDADGDIEYLPAESESGYEEEKSPSGRDC